MWPLVVAAVAVNAAAALALSGAGPVRAAIGQDQRSVSFQTPAAQPTAPTATPGVVDASTPAAQLLGAVADSDASSLLGEAFPVAPSSAGATLTTPACFTDPHPLGAVSRSGSGPLGGVTVQVLTVPTGAGTETVEQWRRDASRCSGTRVASGAWSAATPDGAPTALTAAVNPTVHGGTSPTLTLAAWSRGDVVVVVTYAARAASARTVTGAALDELRGVTAHVDATLDTLLRPVCVDLAPSAADALRNPGHQGYTPYSQTRTITVTDAPKVATPTRPAAGPALPLPVAQPVPALAPVKALTVDQWTDRNNDGKLDTAAPLTSAPRLDAPVLVDPTAFTATSTVTTDPGAAPARPAAGPRELTYQVQVADPDGPGCGWAFTGATAPAVDDADLEALERAADTDALAAAGKARATAWAAQLAWAQDYRTWAQRDADYAPVRQYEQARQDALTAYSAARAAYEKSAEDYRNALKQPPAGPLDPGKGSPGTGDQPNPAPTPTPTPTPTSAPTTTGPKQ